VTIVENGTLANERVMMCSIGSLWETLALNGVEGPAIIYVGLKPARTSADILTFPVRDETAAQVLRAAS
jgi:uroporphyrin-III C-methyltransferase / precorrin-2 dehydrogenase / sirohydrochlorin ferrochelatase